MREQRGQVGAAGAGRPSGAPGAEPGRAPPGSASGSWGGTASGVFPSERMPRPSRPCRGRATHRQALSPRGAEVQALEHALRRPPEVLRRGRLQHPGKQDAQVRLDVPDDQVRNRRICAERKPGLGRREVRAPREGTARARDAHTLRTGLPAGRARDGQRRAPAARPRPGRHHGGGGGAVSSPLSAFLVL